MSMKDIEQARKLLAFLGWTYRLPTIPNRDGVIAWSTQVPIVSTVAKREIATPQQIQDAPMWGDNLDEVDHGSIRISQPYDTTWLRGLTPLEWALAQLDKIPARYVIDYGGELPPMPEAEPLGQLREVIADRSRLFDLRISLSIEARAQGAAVREISAVLGVGDQMVYKILRQKDPLPGRDQSRSALQELAAVIEDIDAMDVRRARLMQEAQDLGVTLRCIGRFAGMSKDNVGKILQEASRASS